MWQLFLMSVQLSTSTTTPLPPPSLSLSLRPSLCRIPRGKTHLHRPFGLTWRPLNEMRLYVDCFRPCSIIHNGRLSVEKQRAWGRHEREAVDCLPSRWSTGCDVDRVFLENSVISTHSQWTIFWSANYVTAFIHFPYLIREAQWAEPT